MFFLCCAVAYHLALSSRFPSRSFTDESIILQTARTRLTGALSAASTANLRWNNRGLPSHVQAIALLVPQQRGYATEPSSSSSTSSESFPPPGFNAEQAKKPLQQEEASQTKDVQKADSAKTESSSAAVQTNADAKNSGAAKTAVAEEDKKAAEKKKLTMGQKIKKEVQHYWDGTKLLATEVKISSRLALKMAGGDELTRREHRQVGFAIDSYLFMLVLGVANWSLAFSFNERQKTWVGWFHSRFSSSFLSPNCFSPSLLNCSPTCSPAPTKARRFARTKRSVSARRVRKFLAF